jgi:hypothetical protein
MLSTYWPIELLVFCTVNIKTRADFHLLSTFFLSALAPRPSSVPPQGSTDVHRHYIQQSNNRYKQHLIRSPSNGNNFIMQSNNGTSTKPAINREEFYPHPAQPPAHVSTVPMAPPLPPPISSIPAPPPLPAQFMSTGSSPWSTLQLPTSGRKNRTLVHDESCK